MSERFALLVVGGGPAGLAAARAYRDAGGAGRVAIATDEDRMPYNRPSLTKELLRGESTEAELPLEPEEWLTHQRVDLIGGRVVALDVDARVAAVSGGRELPYERCVLATGAEPKRLPVPGADHPGVRVLRSLDHLRELQHRLGDDATVTVIGSGFIGCEIAASLSQRGHRVALITDEQAPNAGRLGEPAAAIIGEWLGEAGVALYLGHEVERIEQMDARLAVLAGEETVSAEVVVMATGVAPRSELAVQAGLELDGGAVPVSASMATRQQGLLAAGDLCRAENLAAGRSLRVEHWGDALTQGTIAGRTAAGEAVGWSEVPGFWTTIGHRTLKYAAWGDGFDDARLERHGAGGFTASYGLKGRLVGVLTHDADADYERGRERIAQGAAWR